MTFFDKLKFLLFFKKPKSQTDTQKHTTLNLALNEQEQLENLQKDKNQSYPHLCEKDVDNSKTNTSIDLEKIENLIPKENTLKKLSNFFSSFADNTRLKIISALSFGELCVGDIANILNMNQTTISHQLAFLKSTGSVICRRQGKTIYYKLASLNIEDCLMYGAKHINYDI